MRVEVHAILHADEVRVTLGEHGAARFECDFEECAIDRCELHAAQIEVRGELGIRLARERRDGLLGARGQRIDTDDRVFGCQLLVREVDRAVFVQHGLEAVRRLRPGEVLDVAPRFGDVPGDDGAVSGLPHIMRAGHALLEEDADRRHGVDEVARRNAELIETGDDDAARDARAGWITTAKVGAATGLRRTEADAAAHADGDGVPLLAGERELELLQLVVAAAMLGAEVCIPGEREVLDAIAARFGR